MDGVDGAFGAIGAASGENLTGFFGDFLLGGKYEVENSLIPLIQQLIHISLIMMSLPCDGDAQ